MKIKRFNESEEFEQEFELPKEEQPMFSMMELEAAFLSARIGTYPNSQSMENLHRLLKRQVVKFLPDVNINEPGFSKFLESLYQVYLDFGKPGFPTFKDWYLQELATRSEPRAMDDYTFDMHTRFPFRKSIMNQFREVPK